MSTDVYVSYARIDDSDGLISNFVRDFRQKFKQDTGRQDLTVDMEFDDVSSARNLRIDLAEKIRNSHLMMAMLSPSYFTEPSCAIEWDEFYKKRIEHGKSIIFPVEIRQYEDLNGKFIATELDDEQLTRFNQIKSEGVLTFARFKKTLVEEKINGKLEEFNRAIDNALTEIKPIEQKKKNFHIIDKKIEENTRRNKYEDIKQSIGRQQRAFPELKPVCVIYTGGTVGMVRQEELNRNSALKIGTIEEVMNFIIPKIRELECDIDFYSYGNPLDSSNITSNDWVTLAEIIAELYKYYQGFVILHGANTMAYSASALSFMFENLSKPIILTGAEIPLIELNSDAESNIIRSIQAAAPDLPNGAGNIPEVCILYGNSLIRGNRGTKKNSLSTTEGFYSPNYKPLGTVEHDKMALDYRQLRKATDLSRQEILQIQKNLLKDNVFILDIYPDMDMEIFKHICKQHMKGLIIKTYGTGNAPDEPREVLDELEKLIRNQVVVINLTQCPEGRVELRLFETNARLFDIGVINGGDMTTEATYCKLKYLLGKFSYPADLETINQLMQIDLRGELTDSAYSVHYEKKGENDNRVAPIFRGTAKDLRHFDPASIKDAVLRIQGIKIIGGSKRDLENDLFVKVYFNRNAVDTNESEGDRYFMIGSFKQRWEYDIKHEVIPISQNLPVAEKVRRLISSDTQTATLQVVSANGQSFSFDSMHLIIFTRNN